MIRPHHPLSFGSHTALPLVCCIVASALSSQGTPQKSDAKPAKGKPAGKAEQKPDGDKKIHVFKPMSIPKVVIKGRLGRRITIDGSLADWPKAMPVVLRDPRQVSGTALGAYRGPKDISGQLYMLWDPTHLYYGLQVQDDWHRPMSRKTTLQQEIPPVDNVVITFDPKRDTGGIGDDPGRREDRSFMLAEIESIGDSAIAWDRFRATRALARGARCKVVRGKKTGVTIYEGRLPWSQILPPGWTAKNDLVLDMQVEINDFDEPTDTLPQTRIGWNFGMGPMIHPGLWGSVMLRERFDPTKDAVPVFASPKDTSDSVPGRGYWAKWLNELHNHPPAIAGIGTPDPGMAGGEKRFELLQRLDEQLAAFPRIDNLEFHYRVQRRMTREIGGLTQTGLPFLWKHAFDKLLRRSKPLPKPGVIRVFRLPQGGWYVRTKTASFAVDPCGVGIERLFLRGGIDFVVMTRPTEVTRRHDPTLIRMSAGKPKRPFFTHMEFHLTGAAPGSMYMIKPGKSYVMGGLKEVEAIGVLGKDGKKVTTSLGYLIKWNDGRELLVAGLSLTKELVAKLKKAPDILILSGLHEKARELGHAVGAKTTLIDDAFIAHEYPLRFGGRLSYAKALKLQNQLKPRSTVLLGPADSIDL